MHCANGAPLQREGRRSDRRLRSDGLQHATLRQRHHAAGTDHQVIDDPNSDEAEGVLSSSVPRVD